MRRDETGEIANLPAYLRQTANNLAMDLIRRRNTEMKVLVLDDVSHDKPSDGSSPEEHVEAGQRSRLLTAAIETLPPKCRQVFLMRMHEDLSQDEIARRLNRTPSMRLA